MSEKKFDFMKVGFGARRKPPRVDPKYATFNRRMMAATIDSVLISLLIAPVLDVIFNSFYPQVPVDWTSIQQQLQEKVQAQGNYEGLTLLLWRRLSEAGFIPWWSANMLFQTSVLCVVVAMCWYQWSSTPGKMLLRMRIADAETEKPMSNRQIRQRLWGYFVSSIPLGLGFFWIAWNKRRQGWHDQIAHTVVLVSPWIKAKSGSGVAGPSDSPAP